jgi:hypothetical protein
LWAYHSQIKLVVEHVEKVIFLTNGLTISRNFATFLGRFDFSYSFVIGQKNNKVEEYQDEF